MTKYKPGDIVRFVKGDDGVEHQVIRNLPRAVAEATAEVIAVEGEEDERMAFATLKLKNGHVEGYYTSELSI